MKLLQTTEAASFFLFNTPAFIRMICERSCYLGLSCTEVGVKFKNQMFAVLAQHQPQI